MVDYNAFAKTFSASRKNMKWEEISYFLENFIAPSSSLNEGGFLDIGCGNGRLLGVLKEYGIQEKNYIGFDLSQGLLDEAQKMNPGYSFCQGDMRELFEIIGGEKKYTHIFLIASFHHLESLEDRGQVLSQLYSLLTDDGYVYMTNWALESSLNKDKYHTSKIPESINQFGSSDFDIKIGNSSRYYHSFDISELEYLFKKAGFQVVENRIFDNNKNIISILKK